MGEPLCKNELRPMSCRLPLGHHGRHACAGHCDLTWENENETRPCPSTEVAVLGALSPVALRCGLLFDHDGPHRFAMQWTESGAALTQRPTDE